MHTYYGIEIDGTTACEMISQLSITSPPDDTFECLNELFGLYIDEPLLTTTERLRILGANASWASAFRTDDPVFIRFLVSNHSPSYLQRMMIQYSPESLLFILQSGSSYFSKIPNRLLRNLPVETHESFINLVYDWIQASMRRKERNPELAVIIITALTYVNDVSPIKEALQGALEEFSPSIQWLLDHVADDHYTETVAFVVKHTIENSSGVDCIGFIRERRPDVCRTMIEDKSMFRLVKKALLQV